MLNHTVQGGQSSSKKQGESTNRKGERCPSEPAQHHTHAPWLNSLSIELGGWVLPQTFQLWKLLNRIKRAVIREL